MLGKSTPLTVRQLRPRGRAFSVPRGAIQKAVELLEAGRKSGPFCCFGNDTALTLHRGKGALLDHQSCRPQGGHRHTEGATCPAVCRPLPLALFQEALRVQTEKAQSSSLRAHAWLGGRPVEYPGLPCVPCISCGSTENGAPSLVEGTVQVTGGP